jgi:hypothetical protein
VENFVEKIPDPVETARQCVSSTGLHHPCA